METKSLSELENIVKEAKDAIEYKLVIAALIAMIGQLSFDSRYQLDKVLQQLIRDYDSKMTIDDARRKCKVAIMVVSVALQCN